jgi:hypothetical protein
VDGVNGNDSNNCMSPTTSCKTIGHAISLAASGDTIMVAAATYMENFTISASLNVIGSGASTTIIDGGGVATVVTIPNSTNAHITLSEMTIRNGFGEFGGGVSNGQGAVLTISRCSLTRNTAVEENFSGGLGGGIYNAGTATLTINNSTISGNSAPSSSGGGGGIYNHGTLTINNSTIGGNSAVNGGGIVNAAQMMINWSTLSGNSASGGGGGGISNAGTLTGAQTLTINDSTISGNSASTWHGGGILNTGTLTVNNGTLNGNSAAEGGAIQNGVHICMIGKGCKTLGTMTLQNSIVANSPSGGNCSGVVLVTSKGYNLSSDATCNFSNTGDLNNTDPFLGPLQNNGGPTQTQALLSGSPAIDAGNPGGCTDGQGHLLTTDQRGEPRPDPEDTGGCDMGAYERQID